MKRIISVILTVFIFASMLSTFVFAETLNGTSGDNVSWELDTVTGTLTVSGTGAMKDSSGAVRLMGGQYSIYTPFCYSDPVISSELVFEYDYRNFIKTVIIEEGVTHIGDWAFFGCNNIESIIVPEGLLSIGNNAFLSNVKAPGDSSNDASDNILIKNVYVPNLSGWLETSFESTTSNPLYNAKNIYVNGVLFDKEDFCDKNEFVVRGDAVKIGSYAFLGFPQAERIKVLSGVATIEKNAFYGCGIRELYIPSSISTLLSTGDAEIIFYGGTKEQWNGLGYTTSATVYFNSPILTETTLDSSGILTIINEGMFSTPMTETNVNTPVKHINVYQGTTGFKKNVFKNLTSLESVYLPNSIRVIEDSVFDGCLSLKSVYFGGTVEEWSKIEIGIGNDVLSDVGIYFKNGRTESVTDTVRYLYNDSTKTLTVYGTGDIPDYSKKGSSPWADLSKCVENIVIENGITAIGLSNFDYFTALENVTVPCSIKRIGTTAFFACRSLESIVIPYGITKLGSNVFAACYKLNSIYLPDSLDSIGDNLFNSSVDLKNIYYSGSETDWNLVSKGVIDKCFENATVSFKVNTPEPYIHIYLNDCDTICNVCNFEREITHKYGEFVSDGNATVDADGTKTRVCSVCGDKETVNDIGSKLPTPTPTPQPQPTPTPEIKDTASMFNDIKADAWYKQYVDYAVTYGIFNGTTDTTFAPSMTMTRAQFVQVLANISGVDTTDKNVETVFSDVPSGRWFTPAVKWAFNSGVVTGSGNGKFSPNDNVTREDMCLMLVRYAKYKNIELKATKEKVTFADDAKIGVWAKEAVYTCQMAEIVGGKGNNTFDPKATGSRSEASTIFTRFHQNFVA